MPKDLDDSFDSDEPCLAVLDASDLLATLEFVRMLRLEKRTAHLLVLLPSL
ncbi:MAG: hypothetical protein P4M04_02025 [Acidobacteriota bacterium]|nr:hypothetical protein [Acidobacteriota bacterium]